MFRNVAVMDFVTFTDFFRYILNKSCATLTDVSRNVPCSAILSFQTVWIVVSKSFLAQ